MKKLLILLLVLYSYTVQAQTAISQVSFNTLSDLRSNVGTANTQILLNGLTSVNDGNGGIYMWSASSTATDDGFITIQVTGVTTGRWLRLANANTQKGQSTLSGVALQTAYTIPFGQTYPIAPITVLVQPRSANASVMSWVSTITTSSFTVNFASVPIVGTNNIVVDWVVVKQ